MECLITILIVNNNNHDNNRYWNEQYSNILVKQLTCGINDHICMARLDINNSIFCVVQFRKRSGKKLYLLPPPPSFPSPPNNKKNNLKLAQTKHKIRLETFAVGLRATLQIWSYIYTVKVIFSWLVCLSQSSYEQPRHCYLPQRAWNGWLKIFTCPTSQAIRTFKNLLAPSNQANVSVAPSNQANVSVK